MPRSTPRCNTLQHAATCCNALQSNTPSTHQDARSRPVELLLDCNTLQQPRLTHCNNTPQQHTAIWHTLHTTGCARAAHRAAARGVCSCRQGKLYSLCTYSLCYSVYCVIVCTCSCRQGKLYSLCIYSLCHSVYCVIVCMAYLTYIHCVYTICVTVCIVL